MTGEWLDSQFGSTIAGAAGVESLQFRAVVRRRFGVLCILAYVALSWSVRFDMPLGPQIASLVYPLDTFSMYAGPAGDAISHLLIRDAQGAVHRVTDFRSFECAEPIDRSAARCADRRGYAYHYDELAEYIAQPPGPGGDPGRADLSDLGRCEPARRTGDRLRLRRRALQGRAMSERLFRRRRCCASRWPRSRWRTWSRSSSFCSTRAMTAIAHGRTLRGRSSTCCRDRSIARRRGLIGAAGAVAFARASRTARRRPGDRRRAGLLSAAHAQLFGSPWRHLFYSGLCLTGWLLGLAVGRRRRRVRG